MKEVEDKEAEGKAEEDEKEKVVEGNKWRKEIN